MGALRKGEDVKGVMLGDGWTKAEVVLRRAGATKADVLHAITMAEDDVATCKQYGDDATDAEERLDELLAALR